MVPTSPLGTTAGVQEFGLDNQVAGAQAHVSPPEPVSVVEELEQMVGFAALAAAVGGQLSKETVSTRQPSFANPLSVLSVTKRQRSRTLWPAAAGGSVAEVRPKTPSVVSLQRSTKLYPP